MALNVVMMATGEFALPSLQALIGSGHRLRALITQPDRVNPRGKVHPHPVKEAALEAGIPVLQPESINTEEMIGKLKALRPDVVMVAAYGQILKSAVIEVPRLGTFNLHGSLLPRHRGAAPVQYAVWCGDGETGVTIFQIEPKLDAGPMLLKKATPIELGETAGQLHDRLAVLGGTAVVEALNLLESGQAVFENQQPELVTQCPKIRKEQGEIDWAKNSREIDCHLRAMQPWPNPFTFYHAPGEAPQRTLILKVERRELPAKTLSPGQVLSHDQELLVGTGDGMVAVLQIQPAGKKPMSGTDFLRGRSVTSACRFGPEADSE